MPLTTDDTFQTMHDIIQVFMAPVIINLVLQVADLFADTESNGSVCKLDVMLVYEVFTESRAMMLYPINVLRNLARAQVCNQPCQGPGAINPLGLPTLF